MSGFGFYIEGDVGREAFPERFSNQIFFSDHVADFYLEYETVYSIKYQISGTESYYLEGKRFTVNEGNFLLVNDGNRIICDSGASGKAISIFIDPSAMAGVFGSYINSPDKMLKDPGTAGNGKTLFFYENVYPLTDNKLSERLKGLAEIFSGHSVDTASFGIEFFYDIADALLQSRAETLKQMKSIGSVKFSTREELFRRMLHAREYILDNRKRPLALEDIASAVYMSPYHFHRTFTAVFGITPVKFHTTARLKSAKRKLLSGKYTVSEIARLYGYADIFSFSKAFKNYFGFPPSAITTK